MGRAAATTLRAGLPGGGGGAAAGRLGGPVNNDSRTMTVNQTFAVAATSPRAIADYSLARLNATAATIGW